MRLLTVLKESLQQCPAAHGSNSALSLDSSSPPQQPDQALPSLEVQPTAKRRRAQSKSGPHASSAAGPNLAETLGPLLTGSNRAVEAPQSPGLDASSAAGPNLAETLGPLLTGSNMAAGAPQNKATSSEPLLNGSSRASRTLKTEIDSAAPLLKSSSRPPRNPKKGTIAKADLAGSQGAPEAVFFGPMKPLRPSDRHAAYEVSSDSANRQMVELPAQASDASQVSLSGDIEQLQALQEQAADADTTEAAVEQDIVEEATCAEALSIALSGEPPLMSLPLSTSPQSGSLHVV